MAAAGFATGALDTYGIGAALRFKALHHVARYGYTARITHRQRIEYRRALPGLDRSCVLVDLESENGTRIQWTLSQVKRAMVPA